MIEESKEVENMINAIFIIDQDADEVGGEKRLEVVSLSLSLTHVLDAEDRTGEQDVSVCIEDNE
jgi:hypothetical protein